MGLFDRVFRGSAEMYAKAESELSAVISELGESAPVKMPDTAYFLSCIYAYQGRKVTTLGEMREALAEAKAKMTTNQRTADMKAQITTATLLTPRFASSVFRLLHRTSPALWSL